MSRETYPAEDQKRRPSTLFPRPFLPLVTSLQEATEDTEIFKNSPLTSFAPVLYRGTRVGCRVENNRAGKARNANLVFFRSTLQPRAPFSLDPYPLDTRPSSLVPQSAPRHPTLFHSSTFPPPLPAPARPSPRPHSGPGAAGPPSASSAGRYGRRRPCSPRTGS